MPVIGHAFAGWAIGAATAPPAGEGSAGNPASAARALWVPIAIGISYLPDAASQVLAVTGWRESRIAAHSLPAAIAAAPLLSLALCRISTIPFRRFFILSLSALLCHDLLDLAQATDRLPFWPFYDRPLGFDLPLLPADPMKEALLFGVPFLVFFVLWKVSERNKRPVRMQSVEAPRNNAIRWVGRIAIASLLLAAGGTHYLRDLRERQLEEARALASKGNYREVFRALDLAERWPSCAKPGRIDYLRAEAYGGVGDRGRAEVLYLRSIRDDPTYFWAAADLAKLYAIPEGRTEISRSLAVSRMEALARDFPNQPELDETLASIKRRLAEPIPSSGNSNR